MCCGVTSMDSSGQSGHFKRSRTGKRGENIFFPFPLENSFWASALWVVRPTAFGQQIIAVAKLMDTQAVMVACGLARRGMEPPARDRI